MTKLHNLDELQTILFKLGSIRAIASLLAERLTDNDDSTIAWHIADVARETEEQSFAKIDELYLMLKKKK